MPRIQMIPVDQIEVPETRLTSYFQEDEAAVFAESVDKAGQESPIQVLNVDGRFVLVDGFNRLRQAKQLGRPKIEAVVKAGTMLDAMMGNIKTATQRGKPKASELVKVIESLTTDYGMDSDAIHQATGMSRDYIERLWKIAEGIPDLVDALDGGRIGVGVAFQISRLPHPLQQAEVLSWAILGGQSEKKVKEGVDDILRMMAEPGEPSQQPVTRPAPPPPTCQGCGATCAQGDLVHIILCRGCHGVVFTAAQKAKSEADGGE